jgi:FlaA1/EpsC-like NDP-sugar epimerase
VTIAASILVTGGTGSFGRAFVSRLLRDRLAERICIYSRGEHAQADMRAHLERALPAERERLRWFIGDVRDRDRLRRAMAGVGVVVHAAALKRIEVGHYNPVELVKTNVVGSINVIEAAEDAAGVAKVVALSTDKACEPIGAYGASKQLMESLVLGANNTVGPAGPRFAVTRYGNVWGSQGSVVPTWAAMIEAGAKAVPCTDPEATRFFMMIEDAVGLVLDTIETMPADIVTPALPAYRLGDLAAAFGVPIVVTGLPGHEKRHESMRAGEPSDRARRMSVAELREALVAAGYGRGAAAKTETVAA